MSDLWYDSYMAHTAQITVGERGRIVLPSSIRAELGLTPGTRMVLSTEPDGSLRLRPYRTVADHGRGLYADTEGGSLVAELLADRGSDAEREE
jgi:AbrB family looped-hinge helix DNA binding protein